MAFVTREAALNRASSVYIADVPEWGGQIGIRIMSVAEKVELTDELYRNADAVQAYADDQTLDEDLRKGVGKVEAIHFPYLTMSHVLVDENNKRLFSIDDIKTLTYSTFAGLYETAMRLNGVAQIAEYQEEQKKNFELNPDRRFLFRLALALGRTVAELLDTISPEELKSWRAYYEFEPWGSPADDERTRLVGEILWHAHADGKAKVPLLLDRFPRLTERAREQAELDEMLKWATRTAAVSKLRAELTKEASDE